MEGGEVNRQLWMRLARLAGLFGPNRVSRWIWHNKVFIRVGLGRGSAGVMDNWGIHLTFRIDTSVPHDEIWLASARTGHVAGKIINIGGAQSGSRAEERNLNE